MAGVGRLRLTAQGLVGGDAEPIGQRDRTAARQPRKHALGVHHAYFGGQELMRTVTDVIGDLARPFAIYATAGAAAISTVRLAFVSDDLSGAAVYMGAVFAGLAGLYGFRAWESQKAASASAEVEKVRAQANPPPAEALKPAAPEPTPERSLEDPA